MKIALDAFGGDFAPLEPIKGAIEAAKDLWEHEIILVGREEEIRKELDKYPIRHANISICQASEIIEMGESPVSALMSKKDSSINVGTRLVKDGKAEAFVSAGSTGAVVGAATLYLRTLKGVKRAGIAAPYVTEKGVSVLMDAGSNINCRPLHLVQYAYMSKIYAEAVFSKKNPSIGLVNIGEEDQKGNEVTKETFHLLKDSGLNFIGNVEGHHLSKGACDIILCDGFIGNVILKVSEGIATSLFGLFQRELEGIKLEKNVAGIFQKLMKPFDYAEYGGAPLLGTNGVSIICHGRSNSRAIVNALKLAAKFGIHKINSQIVEKISEVKLPLSG